MYLDIDYQKHLSDLDIQLTEGKSYLMDPIRKKKILITPEELVRQCVILSLIEEYNYSLGSIAIEKTLMINGIPKRFDLVVFRKDLTPFILIECKAPSVKLSQQIFEQASNYNQVLKANYLMITNGTKTAICKMNYEHNTYQFLTQIPNCPS